MEFDHDGMDIRDLILQALEDSEIDADAAAALELEPATLSLWIAKLGIQEDAEKKRKARKPRS